MSLPRAHALGEGSQAFIEFRGGDRAVAEDESRTRGWVNTDRDGFYEFHTIKPGMYPNRTTPAHLHMTVSRRDMPEWWLPEVRFERAPLVTRAETQASAADGRFGNV